MRVCNNANTNWSRSDSSTSSAENEWSEKRRKDPLLGKRHLPHDPTTPILLLVDREKRRFHSLVRRIKGRLLLPRSSDQCYVVAGNHLRRSLRSTTTYESGPPRQLVHLHPVHFGHGIPQQTEQCSFQNSKEQKNVDGHHVHGEQPLYVHRQTDERSPDHIVHASRLHGEGNVSLRLTRFHLPHIAKQRHLLLLLLSIIRSQSALAAHVDRATPHVLATPPHLVVADVVLLLQHVQLLLQLAID